MKRKVINEMQIKETVRVEKRIISEITCGEGDKSDKDLKKS